MLHDELDYDTIVDVFWTDSKVALGYITNDASEQGAADSGLHLPRPMELRGNEGESN